ncbi:methanol dehydrogenase [cytochrome c] subunit [Marinivivus vitaminiproducens]|uniref:methanol dehydrogenase [cytochrome c] subunit n=1 Tax=Marinivivus vitaminiproducens TaxID=3035935 RepID=UPI0027A13B8F|nr:methanol dehydrogenase [cytochrome c] subunit [Geminicoccaceae bacterium SCSIO 64248]
MTYLNLPRCVAPAVLVGFALASAPALAYDGTNCKAPGNCWEPKPGYPEQIAGSQYDPQHDPEELNAQSRALAGMAERNQLRLDHFKKTGEFIYDVDDIPLE